MSAEAPLTQACNQADIPIGNPGGNIPVTPIAVGLIAQGTWFENTFGTLGAAGQLLTVQNGEDFNIEIIADRNMPGGCGKPGNTSLTALASKPASAIYGSSTSYPKVIGACAPSSLTPGRQAVGIVVTYKPN